MKLLLKNFSLFFACFNGLTTFSQQANNWYFPINAGITFNTNPPTVLIDGQCGESGATCMSDENGRLIFYSDAKKVWNKLQREMPNAYGLWGSGAAVGASNEALSLPFPDNPSMFYLFLSESYLNPPSGYSSYNYSIIDTKADGGLGDVVLKNQLIFRPAAEKMTVAQHANGIESWFICLERGKEIYHSYKVGCNGLDAVPVSDTFNFSVPTDSLNNRRAGDFKTSIQNDKMAITLPTGSPGTDSAWLDLFRFNNQTGHLFDKIHIANLIPFRSQSLYTCAFSPSGKYIYTVEVIQDTVPPVNTPIEIHLCRYDLSNWDATAIKNSRLELFNVAGGIVGIGDIQVGPDNNIYVARADYLGVIRNPDSPSPVFIDSFINLAPALNSFLFPKFASNLISNQNVQVTYTVAGDCRTVTLKAKTYIKGNNLAFNWKFGDGDSTIQNIPGAGDTTYTAIVHTYPPGNDTFFVSLTVTSDTVCGLGRAGARVVVKPPPPVAGFGVGNTVCGNGMVQFTDSSLLNFNPSLSYQWGYRPAASAGAFTNFSVLQNPSFNFPSPDSFDVQLTVTSSLSCVASNSITKRIYLKAKPTAAFSAISSCGSLSASFSSNSGVAADTIQTYSWDFGNGQLSADKDPVISFSNFGSQIVKLTVTSSRGCASDTAVQNVLIKDNPVVSLQYAGNACENLPFSIQAGAAVNAGTVSSRQWWMNDVPVNSNDDSLSLTKPAGSYTIKYIAGSSEGCVSDTAVKNIVVDALPLVAFTAVNTCAGNTILLGNNSTGNITGYKWLFGNGDSSGAAIPSYRYRAAGSYNIRLSAITANGCIATATQPVSIEPAPLASFEVTESCIGKAIAITNNTTGNITGYDWQSSDGNNYTGIHPSILFTSAGSYMLRLRVTSSFGCTSDTSGNITIRPLQLVTTGDTTAIINQPLQLFASGAVGYVWQPAGVLNNAATASPVFKAASSGIYPIEVAATTAQGCKGTASFTVTVYAAKAGLLLPNAFSPNGDGLNDVLRLNCAGLQSLGFFYIYDRYGQTIYEQRNCSSNTGWDGRYKGILQNPGAYVYVWQGIDFNGQLLNGKGTVMLVR